MIWNTFIRAVPSARGSARSNASALWGIIADATKQAAITIRLQLRRFRFATLSVSVTAGEPVRCSTPSGNATPRETTPVESVRRPPLFRETL
jgi:hypothetical protein